MKDQCSDPWELLGTLLRRKEMRSENGPLHAPKVPSEVLTIELSMPHRDTDTDVKRVAFKLDPVMEKGDLVRVNSVWKKTPPGTPHPLEELVIAWRERDSEWQCPVCHKWHSFTVAMHCSSARPRARDVVTRSRERGPDPGGAQTHEADPKPGWAPRNR